MNLEKTMAVALDSIEGTVFEKTVPSNSLRKTFI